MNLKGRNFLKLKDFTPEEILYMIDLSADLKAKKKQGIRHDSLVGKNIALIFEKTSTRTRCSFEVAAHDLGMHVTYLDPSGSQIGKKESIADTARVLGRMFDGIEYRGFGQDIVEELAEYAGVPVWNGLTNEFHPTQMLADMLTIREHLGKLKGVKFNVLDEKNNVLETIITNDEGEAITSKYPVRDFEKLTLQEVETKENYKLNNEKQTITLEANQIKDITFKNEKKKGDKVL